MSAALTTLPASSYDTALPVPSGNVVDTCRPAKSYPYVVAWPAPSTTRTGSPTALDDDDVTTPAGLVTDSNQPPTPA